MKKPPSGCMTSRAKVLVCLVLISALPAAAIAQGLTYQPLVGIPGLPNAASNFNEYINRLYLLSISVAALLAVIKIIIAGVKWMLTDIVTSKADAKSDIQGALLGLLLILSVFLILNTINPNLTNLNVLQGARGLEVRTVQAPAVTAATSVPGASPNNPTLTSNTVSLNERSTDIPGEVVTRPGQGSVVFTNTGRQQAEQNCQNRRGFTLGYWVRQPSGTTEFVRAGAGRVATENILSIHCTPPTTP